MSNKTIVIAGADEAGRGALAGPIVGAAVILPDDWDIELKDSKKLTKKQRQYIFRELHTKAMGQIATISNKVIDIVGIQKANQEVLEKAITALTKKPDKVLVDGTLKLNLDMEYESIPHGDNIHQAIMAASIVAKVYRDAVMDSFGQQFPVYGFEKHKGYAAPNHIDAIRKFGRCPIHRISFKIKALGEKK